MSSKNAITVLARLAKNNIESIPLLKTAIEKSYDQLSDEIISVAIETGGPIISLLEDYIENTTDLQADMNIFGRILHKESEQLAPIRAFNGIMYKIGLKISEYEQSSEIMKEELNQINKKLSDYAKLTGVPVWVNFDDNTMKKIDFFTSDPSKIQTLELISSRLSDAGEYKKAIDLRRKQIALCENLYKNNKNEDTIGHLATAYACLSNDLVSIDKPDQAKAYSLKSCDLFYILAPVEINIKKNNIELLSDHLKDIDLIHISSLGDCYNNLSIIDSLLKEYDPALLSAKKAVLLYAKLHSIEPKKFSYRYAIYLNTLSCRYFETDNIKDSIVLLQQCLVIMKKLHDDQPETFGLHYFHLMENLLERQLKLKTLNEAIITIGIMFDTLNTIPIKQLTEVPTHFASHTLKILLSQVYENNTETINETYKTALNAIDTIRSMIQTVIFNNNYDLFELVISMAVYLSERKQYDLSLEYSLASTIFFKNKMDTHDNNSIENMLKALNTHSIRLSKSKRFKDALKTSEEALNIYKSLPQNTQVQLEDFLAVLLNTHSLRLMENDKIDESISSIKHALRIYKGVKNKDDRKNLISMAKVYINLGLRYIDKGEFEKTVEQIRNSLCIYKDLYNKNSDLNGKDVDLALKIYLHFTGKLQIEVDIDLISPIMEKRKTLNTF